VIWPPGAAVREAAIARPSPVPLADRIGPRLQLSLGPCIIGAGLAMLTFSTSGSSYLTNVLPAVVVLGFGLAITVAPLTTTAMSSAPARHAGIASAINNDLARFGGLLAVAVLPCAGGHHRPGLPAAGRARRGFRTAVLISGGLLAAVTITNPRMVPRPAGGPTFGECLHCGLDAPPLITSVSRATGP